MKVRDWSRIRAGALLIVTWIDTTETSEWTPDEEAQDRQPATCKTVGWFVNDDKDNIRLTWSVAEDGDKSIGVIPKGCIKDVKRINYK